MANAPYAQGLVSVGSTATLICSPGAGHTVYLSNNGSNTVFLGGPTVTASGATAGPSLAASATILLPAEALTAHDLYGITASSTSNVAFLYPS